MNGPIALADAADPRILQAAAELAETENWTPLLLGGDVAEIPTGTEHIVLEPGVSPLDQLAELVGSGEAAAGIAGSLSTSASVIRAGLRRLRPPGGLVSACFAIKTGERWSTYADCVVTPEPEVEQLARIAIDAADHHRRLFGVEPKVAMLSFSTHGSADHPRVAAVREATALIRETRPDLDTDGEVQFDVAVDPVVARHKAPSSAVAGEANVLVFPSLEAANIAYKVAERVGGARALGSFVLGLAKPWVDLSRGCSVADIVDTARLLASSNPTATGEAGSHEHKKAVA